MPFMQEGQPGARDLETPQQSAVQGERGTFVAQSAPMDIENPICIPVARLLAISTASIADIVLLGLAPLNPSPISWSH